MPPPPAARRPSIGSAASRSGCSPRTSASRTAPLLAEIVAVGATHVALVVPLYQTDATAHDLGLHTRLSPTLAALAEVVARRQARRPAGDDVPDHPPLVAGSGQWRGTLAPRDRDAWFKRYGDLLGELGAVAAVTGATRLVVGSELSSLEDDLDHWRPLVERVRAIFGGKLVYSANWDHYQSTALFDLVDEEGISGYFNLRDAKRARPTTRRWTRAGGAPGSEIEAWRIGRTRPFIFTELGYRSRKGVTAAPWDEAPGGTPDLDEQRRAFASFRRVWSDAPPSSTASTSGTGTATAASGRPATRPAASRPRPKSARCSARSSLVPAHSRRDQRPDPRERRDRNRQVHRPELARAVAARREDHGNGVAAPVRQGGQPRLFREGPDDASSGPTSR